MNFKKAVLQVVAALGGGRDEKPAITVICTHDDETAADDEPAVFPTIVVGPPWRYDNKATRGAVEDHYGTMSLDELAPEDPSAIPRKARVGTFGPVEAHAAGVELRERPLRSPPFSSSSQVGNRYQRRSMKEHTCPTN